MNERQPISLDELLAQNAEHILRRLVRELKASGGPTYQRMPVEVLQTPCIGCSTRSGKRCHRRIPSR